MSSGSLSFPARDLSQQRDLNMEAMTASTPTDVKASASTSRRTRPTSLTEAVVGAACRVLEGEEVIVSSIVGDRSLSSLPLHSLPLLDATTCSEDESSISLSSLSDDDCQESHTESSTSTRSIFKDYWDKHGDMGSLQRCAVSPPLPQQILLDDSTTPTYEQVIRAQEQPKLHRRRIFGSRCWTQSCPTLPESSMYRDLRKTRSTSALSRSKSTSSCLRSGRYSAPAVEETSESSEASVSFNPKVEVKYYEPPVERWAALGWSEFFAC